MIDHRRIVQILPAPSDSYVLFLGNRPDGCSVSPVVCLALVDRWESDERYCAVPDTATREVLPMIETDGFISIPDDAVNYQGYYSQAAALELLRERLSELCAKDTVKA